MRLRIWFVFCLLYCSTVALSAEIPAYLRRNPELIHNPFKGLFQNWENRQTNKEESISRINKYADALIEIYPESKAENIRLFILWHYFGNENLKISAPSQTAASDPWAEAVRMVQFFHAGNNREAGNILQKLLRELPSDDLLRFELLKMKRWQYRNSSSEYKHFDRMVVECVESIAISGKYINTPAYQQLYNELSQSSHCGSRYWGRLENKLNPHAGKIDPWFWEMIQGRAAIAWAWESRGGGWADSVSDDGWEGFGKNLQKARTHFYKAVELRPAWVNPHIQLITVEMGSSNQEGMINIFKKLVWHNPANEAGWRKLLWGLLPRWGGSLELIKMLAIEAMDSPRRDAKVHYFGYQALAHIAQYHQNYRWQQVYLDPEVMPQCEKIFKEWENNIKTDSERKYFLKFKTVRHLALLEYDEALKAAREYGGIGSLKNSNWWHWGFFPDSPIGTVFYDDIAMRLSLFTGKYKEALQKAEKLFVHGTNDAQAFALLTDVIINGDLTPPEKDYLIDLYGRWRLNYSPEEFTGENGRYKSAYVVAGKYNRSDIAEEMVKLGYNASANENFPGESVYNIAAEGVNIDGLKKLHAQGAKLTLPSPKTGHTPIHVAARYGNTGMVKALLDLGVPVDLKDNNGHTALHIAATMKHPQVIELLLNRGANPNLGDNEEDFCLIYLPQVRASCNIWKLFTEHPAINVNKQNHAGVSALHYMAKFNTPADVFELMLSKGADINIRDNSGKTPLDMAEAGGHLELAGYLIKKGGKRNSELPPVKEVNVAESESVFDTTTILQITIIALPLLLLLAAVCRKYCRKQ